MTIECAHLQLATKAAAVERLVTPLEDLPSRRARFLQLMSFLN